MLVAAAGAADGALTAETAGVWVATGAAIATCGIVSVIDIDVGTFCAARDSGTVLVAATSLISVTAVGLAQQEVASSASVKGVPCAAAAAGAVVVAFARAGTAGAEAVRVWAIGIDAASICDERAGAAISALATC